MSETISIAYISARHRPNSVVGNLGGRPDTTETTEHHEFKDFEDSRLQQLHLLLIPKANMSACIFSTRSSVFRAARTAASTRYFALAPRLLSTLAVLEHKEGKVLPQSLPVITAAAKFGGDVTAFLAGTDVKSVAEQVVKLNGVTKVLTVSNGAYDKVCTSRPYF